MPGVASGYTVMMHFWNKLASLRKDRTRRTQTQQQQHADAGATSVAGQMPTVCLPLLQGWKEAGGWVWACKPGPRREARAGRGKLQSLGRGFNLSVSGLF